MQTASLPNCLCALEEEDLRHRFLILYGTQPPPRLAAAYGVPGARARNALEFATALREAIERGGPGLIEVPDEWRYLRE